MERLSILLDKFVKNELVQKRFMSYLGGFVCPEEMVSEGDLKEELLAFVTEYPEFESSVTLN